MRHWNYFQVSFLPKHLDQASGILWGLGTRGIEEDRLYFGKLRIRAYFDPLQNIQVLHREFKAQCQRAGISLYRSTVRIQTERDWFKKWRRQLQPFTVGRRFQIVPADSSNHPRTAASGTRIPIYLEPGMAFGTGTHETTQLCLEALERDFLPGKTCLDVGTGSGILAIAAVKLGARHVVACDVDPIAVEIATQNGAQNNCGTKVRWVQGDIEKVHRFQPGCLVANLTVEIIEQEFWQFEQRLRRGSLLIVSGVLNRQARRIERLRHQSTLQLRRRLSKGEWTCLVYHRP